MTGYHFTITSAAASTLLAHALVCPATRYSCVRWRVAARLDRRMVSPADWRHVIEDLATDWPEGIVTRESHLARAIYDSMTTGRVTVRLLTEATFENTSSVVGALDGYLRRQQFP